MTRKVWAFILGAYLLLGAGVIAGFVVDAHQQDQREQDQCESDNEFRHVIADLIDIAYSLDPDPSPTAIEFRRQAEEKIAPHDCDT